MLALVSWKKDKTAIEILQNTINAIDSVETIYYKQDMRRTNPQNLNDTIFRYREMYFKRLITDSIVGVQGHWYMYIDDKENVIYEDIYDGNRLIRKNNRDSIARVYDLVKYPDFKKTHFWSHNTLYGIQYELRFILENTDSYSIERLNDTVIDNKDCFQINIVLEDRFAVMPGFAIALEDQDGSISITKYFIDKETNYPIRIISESYSADNPDQKVFLDQKYYDLKFNIEIDEQIQFNTTDESLTGFEKIEMKPQH